MTYSGVAISGRAGSGKTTLARALVDAGIAGHVASLAGQLKQDLLILGVQKGQPHARETMIAYGQNRRAVNADYWIEKLEANHGTSGYVCDDMRFPNEHRWFRAHGFLLVRVDTHPDVRADRLGLDLDDLFLLTEDPSEASIEHAEFDVHLDGTIPTDGLVAAVRLCLERPHAHA